MQQSVLAVCQYKLRLYNFAMQHVDSERKDPRLDSNLQPIDLKSNVLPLYLVHLDAVKCGLWLINIPPLGKIIISLL